MATIPSLSAWSSAVGLAREGFAFLYNRCRRFQSDLFEIRVPFLKIICISGPEAAQLFYDPVRFQRRNAIPKRIQKTLFGEKTVQVLDDAAHRRRKDLFMSVMTPDRIRRLSDLLNENFRQSVRQWEKAGAGRVVLFDQVQQLLCRAACAWVGLPLTEREVPRRSRLLWQMVDAFGAVGPRHLRGRWARSQTEDWVRGLVRAIRAHQIRVPEGSPAQIMISYRDEDGQPLADQLVTVELINLIRPIVAISTYIVFAALALHQHPEQVEKLRNGDENDLENFVHEVRRYYPFAPFLGALVRSKFDWRGCHFPKGALVLMDVYGTNRHPDTWEHPLEFRPDRFRQWDGSAFNFIPQGGGDYHQNHRCAGEWVTIETVKVAVTFFTRHLQYEVPTQDLGFKLSRMPTYPRSGFVISHVRGTDL